MSGVRKCLLNVAVLMGCTAALVSGGACPNFCSGHGNCEGTGCKCEVGWDVLADCSERTCPFSAAWTSRAHAEGEAHSSMECSNRGSCDRVTGLCRCDEGFGGQACERMECPGQGNCGGFGTCLTTAHAADEHAGVTYSQWDGSMTQVCICSWGRLGADCSIKMCPKGDDPMTVSAGYHTVQMTLTTADNSATGLAGTVVLKFDGHEATMAADADAAACEAAWESLGNVEDVSCTRSVDGSSGYTAQYTVELRSFPLFPSQNNVYSHTGNPAASSFSCDPEDAAPSDAGLSGAVYCTFATLMEASTREYETCSGRGKCGADGVCACFEGFTGAACQDTATGLPDPGARDVLNIESTISDFTGTLLTLETSRAASTEFKVLEVTANDVTLASMAGDGAMSLASELTVGTGMTVSAGGLSVSGGTTVHTGGLEVKAGGFTVGAGDVDFGSQVDVTMLDSTLTLDGQTGGIVVELAGVSPTQTGLLLQQTGTSSNSYKFLEVGDESDTTLSTIFTIHGGPGTEISRGGLTVVGGVTVESGGLEVEAGGATVVGSLSVDGISTTGAISGTSATFSSTVTTTQVITTSDRRLKENIQPIGNRSEALLELEGVTYDMRQRSSRNETATDARDKLIGLIAQDVAKHFPELVKQDESGWLAVHYTGLTPVIIEVLKTQRDEIQELRRSQESIAELLSRIKQLEDRLAVLEGGTR